MSEKDVFEGLRLPPAPSELRARVLRAARSEEVRREGPTLEERLWSSWSLRLAWMSTVAALLIVNLLLPADPPSAPRNLEPAAALKPADLDRLPEQPTRVAGGDRIEVLCELQVRCPEPDRALRGEQA